MKKVKATIYIKGDQDIKAKEVNGYLSEAYTADNKKIDIIIHRAYRYWKDSNDQKEWTTDCWTASDLKTGGKILPSVNPKTRELAKQYATQVMKDHNITYEVYKKATQDFTKRVA